MNIYNYNDNIVNIPNSILKYFGFSAFNSSSQELDSILQKDKPKNVIVILCDGMGINILNKFFSENDFLQKYFYRATSSIFPATTVSATTSIITGLYPNQHCWLGWYNYIEQIDKVVTMYLNTEKDTNIKVSEENISNKLFPYTTIMNKINSNSNYKASYLSPFTATNYRNLNDMCNKILDLCNQKDKNFIYAYYQNPDEIMHKTGVYSIETKREMQNINNELEKLCEKLNDSIIIITADHGLIDCSFIYLEDHPDLFKYLARTTSIDSRASMFFTKKDKNDEFKKLFNYYFKDNFILLSKNEIIDNNLFGIGSNHILFESCLGDFIAIATKDLCIKYQRDNHIMLANHSGITKEELEIPIILVRKQ